MIKRVWLLVQSIHLYEESPFTYSHRVDIELGFASFGSTPPIPEGRNLGEVIASSAPSAVQDGEAAQSTNMPVSVPVQNPRIQPDVPTTVDAVTSPGSDFVEQARVDSNEVAGGHVENEHAASTYMERQEVHAAANVDL